MNPRARCSFLLRPSLVTCGRTRAEHDGRTGHQFQGRWQYKRHIMLRRIGISFCGRKTAEEWLSSDSESVVRAAGLDNSVCTSCFRNYLWLRERQAFLLPGLAASRERSA